MRFSAEVIIAGLLASASAASLTGGGAVGTLYALRTTALGLGLTNAEEPFCSGMHWYADFHDPPPPEQATVFQWAGGFPALLRLTRRFYETHVPQDPLLSGLFSQMSPDHPERVASWLGQVFGGPPAYSERYGDTTA